MFELSGEVRRALIVWCVANILGLGIPPLVMYFVPTLTAISGLFSTSLIIALPLSITQWAALRASNPVSFLWMFSAPISVLTFVLLIREIPEDYFGFLGSETLIVLSFFGLFFGFFLGLPQWLILSRRVSGSAVWLLGSTLGVGLGAFFVGITDLVNRSGIVAYVIMVLVYTISTGLSLTSLLKAQDEPDKEAPSVGLI
jgi:hypothetical protein